MTFESLLDAATELLKRRRRITYRALQREFGIDDGTLADLRDELILGQRVARDENDLVLEWIVSEVKVGERRWLTVMFCDLVGSTKLSARLDPEDLRDVVRGYHEECAAVLRPLGGYIAQYLGDGILVYFGYPVANEDDAERAIRAGLQIVRAVGQFSTRFGQRLAGGLAVRVGIHTGRVVVADLGDASHPETLALGEAPNIAAHIQSVASPGEVLISQSTFDLLPLGYAADDLGLVVLKDPANPVHLRRVQGDLHNADGPLLQPQRTPLVDPAGHFERLTRIWQRVCDGEGRLMILRGEAGLGKSRLAAELCDRVRAASHPVRVLRCSAFHRHSALHPIAQHLMQRAGVNSDAPGDDMLQRLNEALQADGIERVDAPELLGALVGRDGPGTATLTAAQRMQALQTLLFEWLSAASAAGPVLLLVEDIQWTDPSTLAVLRRFSPGRVPQHLLMLMTARLDTPLPWDDDPSIDGLWLKRMPDDAVRGVVMAVSGGGALTAVTVEQIVRLAEGVPLYAEQIARSVIEPSTQAKVVEVPANLGASLTARLDRLAGAKAIAQTAALLGREFSVDLLSAVCELPSPSIQSALRQLVSGGILSTVDRAGGLRYTFCHALLQTAAAESMLRPARQSRHLRIAEVLQQHFSKTVEYEPETLARHLTGAGLLWSATAQWRAAGEHALARSAVVEGLSHLQQGLALLPEIAPSGERDALELGLQVALASALRAVQGVAARDTGAAYERAAGLAQSLGDSSRLIPVLNGLYSYHLVGGRFESARGPAQQLLDLARARNDRLFQMIGHRAVGAVLLHTGDPTGARSHLDSGLAMYDPVLHAPMAPQLGIDHRVMVSNFLGMALALLGEDEAARARLDAALAWARQIDHAHSLSQALAFHCIVGAVQDRWSEVPAVAQETMALGREHGFALMAACGVFFLHAAQALLGGPQAAERALPEMRAALDLWWQTGATNYRPLCQALLARVQALAGRLDDARQTLALAHRQMEESGERWFESGLWKVQSTLLPEDRDRAQARAVAVARAQGAAGLERRAIIA